MLARDVTASDKRIYNHMLKGVGYEKEHYS